uniref:Uncharacterized protein n=1 Tax=Arundo donax TaxID=35708 RepID=A0A0A9GHQ8_ARUDO
MEYYSIVYRKLSDPTIFVSCKGDPLSLSWKIIVLYIIAGHGTN